MTDVEIKPFAGVPDSSVPVIFVDGVANISNNKNVVKLLLYRTDPSVGNHTTFANVAVAQIICDFGGFAQIVTMLNSAAAGFAEQNQISENHMEVIKGALGKVAQ